MENNYNSLPEFENFKSQPEYKVFENIYTHAEDLARESDDTCHFLVIEDKNGTLYDYAAHDIKRDRHLVFKWILELYGKDPELTVKYIAERLTNGEYYPPSPEIGMLLYLKNPKNADAKSFWLEWDEFHVNDSIMDPYRKGLADEYGIASVIWTHNDYHAENMKGSHKQCLGNMEILRESGDCGCFFCKRIFPFSEIKDAIKERDGRSTARCPYCGTDSVIPTQCQTNDRLFKYHLSNMNDFWFMSKDSEKFDIKMHQGYNMPMMLGALGNMAKGGAFEGQTVYIGFELDRVLTLGDEKVGEDDRERIFADYRNGTLKYAEHVDIWDVERKVESYILDNSASAREAKIADITMSLVELYNKIDSCHTAKTARDLFALLYLINYLKSLNSPMIFTRNSTYTLSLSFSKVASVDGESERAWFSVARFVGDTYEKDLEIIKSLLFADSLELVFASNEITKYFMRMSTSRNARAIVNYRFNSEKAKLTAEEYEKILNTSQEASKPCHAVVNRIAHGVYSSTHVEIDFEKYRFLAYDNFSRARLADIFGKLASCGFSFSVGVGLHDALLVSSSCESMATDGKREIFEKYRLGRLKYAEIGDCREKCLPIIERIVMNYLSDRSEAAKAAWKDDPDMTLTQLYETVDDRELEADAERVFGTLYTLDLLSNLNTVPKTRSSSVFCSDSLYMIDNIDGFVEKLWFCIRGNDEVRAEILTEITLGTPTFSVLVNDGDEICFIIDLESDKLQIRYSKEATKALNGGAVGLFSEVRDMLGDGYSRDTISFKPLVNTAKCAVEELESKKSGADVFETDDGEIHVIKYSDCTSYDDCAEVCREYLGRLYGEHPEAVVVRMVHMWKEGGLDLSGAYFREQLAAANEKNLEGEFLMHGETGYIAKKLKYAVRRSAMKNLERLTYMEKC